MSFSKEQTKLDLFGLTIGRNAKARWLSELEKAKTALLEADDPEGSIHLDDVINAFIALYCDEEARDAQLAYVHNVHKPYDSMSVRDFQMNLENCNSIAGRMPGVAPILSPEELKRAFFQAMPHRWQLSYNNTGRSLNTDTIIALMTFFAHAETHAQETARMQENRQK